jgi:hypothetical protein
MRGTGINIRSKELAQRAVREANLQGLTLNDIVEKALTAYLRSQAVKRKESKYLLWHVDRNRADTGAEKSGRVLNF